MNPSVRFALRQFVDGRFKLRHLRKRAVTLRFEALLNLCLLSDVRL